MSDKTISPEQVVAYLEQNADFFAEHPKLLADLKIPHQGQGQAVSLIEKQVLVLRDRNVELRQRLRQLLDVASENDKLFAKTRSLLLDLMASKGVADIYAALQSSLQDDFGADQVALLLIHSEAELDERYAFARRIAADKLNPHLVRLMSGQKAVCGVLRADEVAALFAEQAENVGSAALVPLNFKGKQIGLLAIGSYDPEHFKSSLGTLFISHIGEVLSRALAATLSELPTDDLAASGANQALSS